MEGQCWRETRNHQQNLREHSQALSELHRQADRIDAWLKPNKNQKQRSVAYFREKKEQIFDDVAGPLERKWRFRNMTHGTK